MKSNSPNVDMFARFKRRQRNELRVLLLYTVSFWNLSRLFSKWINKNVNDGGENKKYQWNDPWNAAVCWSDVDLNVEPVRSAAVDQDYVEDWRDQLLL